MNRIEKTTKKLQRDSKGLVGYFMAGEFSHARTLELLHAGVDSGLDFIELGFPFSDPSADGGTIQESAKKSLANGTTLSDVFKLVEDFRKTNQHTPIILMGYFNVIFQYGQEKFLNMCSSVEVDGLIIVDLPIEESLVFQTIAEKYNIFLIQIVSFLTDKKRFAEIQSRAKGFIYLVSTLGITGQTLPMTERIANYITENNPQLPVFVGFGISSSDVAKDIANHADGIIVGSHFINLARESVSAFSNGVREIKDVL